MTTMNNVTFRGKIGYGAVIGIIGLLAVMHLTGGISGVRSPLTGALNGVQEALWHGGSATARTMSVVTNPGHTAQQLRECRTALTEERQRATELRRLREQNEQLQQALDVNLPDDPHTFVFAGVTGRGAQPHTILLNSGTNAGIREGMPVITAQRALVGRVRTVYPRRAVVGLTTDTNSVFAGALTDKDIDGLVTGAGNELRLTDISREADIETGDTVITSRLTEEYPPDLLVGAIQRVQNNDIETGTEGVISPAYRVHNLSYVFVITDPQS